MPQHGGYRATAGRKADPTSGRSEAAGRKALHLPYEPRTARPPKWPLPESDSHERARWEQLWQTFPQAHAWIKEPWRWNDIALYVRITIRCEEDDSQAALAGVMFRLRDEIGIGPNGLRANGWVIDNPGAIAADEDEDKPKQANGGSGNASAKSRLKAGTDG